MPPTTTSRDLAFDLTVEPWISAVNVHGEPVNMSLRDILTSTAPPALRLAGEPPIRVAVTRLLLGILHDALGGPVDDAQWAQWWKAGTWPTDKLSAYLDSHAHRMRLFDPEFPFMQALSVEAMPHKTIADIVTHRPSGNNPTIFSHNTGLTGSSPLALTPEEAIRWILVSHSFARCGLYPGPAGRGSATQAVLTNRHVAYPTGSNVTETLLLNLTTYTPHAHDVPPWRQARGAPDLVAGPPAGLVQLLTWRTRLILLEEDDPITECIQAADPRVPTHVDPRWLHDNDPHLSFREDPKNPGVLWPISCDPARAVWRVFSTLLGGPGAGSAIATAHRRTAAGYILEGTWTITVAGVAMEAKAKPVAWHHETLPYVPAPLVTLATDISTLTGSALRKAVGVALQEAGVSSAGDTVAAVTGQWWRALDRPAQDLLRNLSAAKDEEAALALIEGWEERLFITADEAIAHACQPYPPQDSLRASTAGRRVLRAVIAKGKDKK